MRLTCEDKGLVCIFVCYTKVTRPLQKLHTQQTQQHDRSHLYYYNSIESTIQHYYYDLLVYHTVN